MSLIEVMVSIGIMSIMLVVFTTMMTNQNKEIKAMNEKMAVQESFRLLSASLSSGKACKYALNNPTALTFNSTAPFPQTINLSTQAPPRPIYSYVNEGPPVVLGPVLANVGSSISPLAPQLTVSQIRLVITGGSGNEYLGNWVIDFAPGTMVRALKPISISTTLNVDATVPAAARIVSCLEPATPLPQTWYNVLGSRANSVPYQNTAAMPMTVSASATGFQPWAYLLFAVGPSNTGPWTIVDSVTCYDTGSVQGVVPPGSWYRIYMGGSLAGARTYTRWTELR